MKSANVEWLKHSMLIDGPMFCLQTNLSSVFSRENVLSLFAHKYIGQLGINAQRKHTKELNTDDANYQNVLGEYIRHHLNVLEYSVVTVDKMLNKAENWLFEVLMM